MTATHHRPQLLGRTEAELLGYQRRSLVQAAAVWTALGGWTAAQAQGRGNIVELRGDVLRNGEALRPGASIAPGDSVQTGPGSTVVFVVGDSAYLVRQNTRMALDGDTPAAVKALRLLSGAVASVWGRGRERQVVMPTATAGIRGTGVYAEVFAEQAYRGYFCNCYGTVDLASGAESVVLPPVFLGGARSARRAPADPRPGHQPHGRGAGVPGRPGAPAHGLADRGAQGQQGRQRADDLLTIKNIAASAYYISAGGRFGLKLRSTRHRCA